MKLRGESGKLRVLLVAFIVAAVVQCYAQDNRQAAFCAAIPCRAEEPTLATIKVVFDDKKGNRWEHTQVVPVGKSGYTTNDIAYIGTVTAIRPDAITEWEAMIKFLGVLWEDYEKRMERRRKIEQRRKEPTRKSKVNKWAQELRRKYKGAK